MRPSVRSWSPVIGALLLSIGMSHTPPVQAADWLVISGLSHHFQPDRRDWREVNPGLGLERESEEYTGLSWTAGYFRNSYDRHTVYAGARWMPWRLGPVQYGGYALAASGYPSPVLLLPGLSVEGKGVGLNLVVLPNLPGYSGYLGAQLRFRLD